METVVDCCYRQLRLKCDRAPRPTLKDIDKFRLTLYVFILIHSKQGCERITFHESATKR